MLFNKQSPAVTEIVANENTHYRERAVTEINIRTTTLADADTISEFNQLMAMETENKKLPDEVIDSGVRRLMQQPEYGFYLVAEIENRTVGTCMITKELSLIHI